MENYFSEAQSFANNEYSNYDGWDYAGGSYDYADDYQSEGVGAEAKASLPFIINISNSTTDDVSNVVFLGANSNLFGTNNFGNVAAITIRMDNGNVTYSEFLESIKSEPFRVGLMYLQSSNSTQPFNQLLISYREPNGGESTLPVSPALDPMQNQGGVTIIKHQFPVNAFTKITTTILASSSLVVRLYPMEQLDVSRGLSGLSVGKNYSRPNLSQFQLPSRNGLVG